MGIIRLLKSFFRIIVGIVNFFLGYIVRFLAVLAVNLVFRPKVLYRNKATQKRKLKRFVKKLWKKQKRKLNC